MLGPTPLHLLWELGDLQDEIVGVQLLLLSFPTKMDAPQVPALLVAIAKSEATGQVWAYTLTKAKPAKSFLL